MTITATATPSTTTSPLLRTGVLASLTGAAVTEAFALVARAAGIPMAAADPGATAAKTIPVGGFAMGVLMNAVIGIVLAFALQRWASRPARTFAVTTSVLVALSELAPVFAAHTTTATKVVLFVAHLIAAAIIVTPITRSLAEA